MIDGARLPTLEAKRVRLRWITHADAPALYSIFSDPEVCRYWSSPPQKSVADATGLVRDIHQLFHARQLFEWGIALRDTDQIIGTATLAKLDPSNRRAEIGFSVASGHWGRGIASEAIDLLLAFSFDTLDLHRIEADVDPRNALSIRVLEKFGFLREGFLRERWIVDGQIADTLMLGLLQREWRARPPSSSATDGEPFATPRDTD